MKTKYKNIWVAIKVTISVILIIAFIDHLYTPTRELILDIKEINIKNDSIYKIKLDSLKAKALEDCWRDCRN